MSPNWTWLIRKHTALHQMFITRQFPGMLSFHHSTLSNSMLCSCTVALAISKVIDRHDIVAVGAVTERVYNWRYKKIQGTKLLSEHEVLLPDIETVTPAFWIEIPEAVKASYTAEFSDDEQDGFIKAIHTATHAIMAIAPTITQCAIQEIQSEHNYRERFPQR